MQVAYIVQKFKSRQHLDPDHVDGFLGKISVAKVKELVEIWTQDLHYQAVEVILNAVPVDLRKPNFTLKVFVYFGLVLQLWLGTV